MTVRTLECGCVVTLHSVRIEHTSEERTRRVVCPHGNESDIQTKAGKYVLPVKPVSSGVIESVLNIPV